MKKVLKKILIISDDYDMDSRLGHGHSIIKAVEPGNYYYSNTNANNLKFKLDIIESWHNLKVAKYDAILVDYGFVGGDDEEKAIEVLQDIAIKKIPLAWCGAMAGRYREDVKKLFPKLRFLHDLPFCGIGSDEILNLLYRLL